MYHDLQITVNIVYLVWRYFSCTQIKYVHFHNIKFKMPKSRLLIGLEASFNNDRKLRRYILYQKCTCHTLPPAYSLYGCEHVDNYGWPISVMTSSPEIGIHIQMASPRLWVSWKYWACWSHQGLLPAHSKHYLHNPNTE